MPIRDAAPANLPEAILERVSAPAIDPGQATGTLWRWSGRAGNSTRVVLLNDGPERRRVQIRAPGECVQLDLEAEEVTCLELPADGRFVKWMGLPVATEEETDSSAPAIALSEGWTLSVPGHTTIAIDPARGWERQGLETFAGVGTYRCRFDRPAVGADEDRWTLTLPVVHCTARAALNGTCLGSRGWRPYRFNVPPGLLRARDNELELEVAGAAANYYYAGTRFQHGLQPSGLGATPVLRSAAVASQAATR
jgi:hypothetical protein